MNLIGFVQALLLNISLISGINDPQMKVTPVGFLKMLLENNALLQVNNLGGLQSGQDRDIKIRYMQRGLESEVSDTDDCETPMTAEWNEASIGRPLFSKIGIFISDENMRKYEQQATATLAAGNPSAPLMTALYETIIVKVNSLVQRIDKNLIAAQATKFGVNVATGNNAAQPVNFNVPVTMDDGFFKLLLDAQANEVNGDLLICGSGDINAVELYNKFKSAADQFGQPALNFKVYNDLQASTGWGQNHFGTFAKGNVGFVDFNKNVGTYAGVKGGSMFFTIPVPTMLANGDLVSLKFDAQLKYEDCPILDDQGAKIADRGWKLILSKSYGLFNTPNDVYAATDRLAGVNGSFHYIGTIIRDTQA